MEPLWKKFHTLWGQAKDGVYVKDDWGEFQLMLERRLAPPRDAPSVPEKFDTHGNIIDGP